MATSALEWIEQQHDLRTISQVASYLSTLSALLAAEAETAKGREKHYLLGQSSGIETALTALARIT